MDVEGVICNNVDEEEEEDDDDDEEEEEEEIGELTLTILGLVLMTDSKGNEIAEMSAAVVSTGTMKVSSTSKSGSKPMGTSGTEGPKMSVTWEIEDPMSKVWFTHLTWSWPCMQWWGMSWSVSAPSLPSLPLVPVISLTPLDGEEESDCDGWLPSSADPVSPPLVAGPWSAGLHRRWPHSSWLWSVTASPASDPNSAPVKT